MVALSDDHSSVVLSPSSIESSVADRDTDTTGTGFVVTITESEVVLTPLPQERLYVVVVTGETLVFPLRALLPPHPSLASQLLALVEIHVRVALSPSKMEVGDAERSTVGVGGGRGVTVIVMLSLVVLAPLPHVIAYVTVVNGETISEPLRVFVPVHPSLAMHVDAFDDDHVRVDVAPSVIEVGMAVMSVVGVGGGSMTSTVTESVEVLVPSPQVKVYVVSVVGERCSLPESALLPDHPPDATHDDASSVVHESVVVAPRSMLPGVARRSTFTGSGGGGGISLQNFGSGTRCGSRVCNETSRSQTLAFFNAEMSRPRDSS